MFARLRIYAGSACYSWQITRREFACCASLGERLTTHMGVIALVFVKPFGHLALGVALANKKLPPPGQGRAALIRPIAV